MNKSVPARERILEAAMMLFWHDGYHAVSTDMICKAAAVTKSSLYNAFPSKAQILATCLDTIWERNWRSIRAIYEGPRGALEKFLDHLKWFETSQRELRDISGAILGTFDMAIGVSIPPEVLRSIKSHQALHSTLIVSTIAKILCLPANSHEVTWLAAVIGDMIISANIRARVDNDIVHLATLPRNAMTLLNLHRPSQSD